jgi:hypothetical protein
MAFDPHAEPCYLCGRESDECICTLAPDIPETVEVLDEFDPDFYYEGWGEEKQ